ncbi:aminotransferase class I/II-fold pyridoxal phosphate-dependent enzyme [bacterium]|nr:aminotransferase class I/II-fold pyridoxal phosphate-dependent enzyme [bacterium]
MIESGLSRYLVESDWPLGKVMEHVNAATSRVVFVMKGECVVGALSDGDIRRALLEGKALDEPVSDIMVTEFAFARPNTSPAAMHTMFGNGISAIPVLAEDGRLVDIRFEHLRSIIPVAEPEITAREIQLVNECLTSGWISSAGRFVLQFESDFANFIGVQNAVSVSSGTTGLVLALKALGIGEGDEVIVPDLTFGATANAVVQVGARPVLVDVSEQDWCLDTDLVRQSIGPLTRAVLPVHLYGRAADIDSLLEIREEFGIYVIEDCAEAIGTHDAVAHVGTRSDAGVFSFFANKTITTGEGGMVCFRSPDKADLARSMKSHGFSNKKRYWHEQWGTNFRLTSLQAALGIAQLERADSIVARRLSIAVQYRELLEPLVSQGLQLPNEQGSGQHSHWLYTVLLPVGCDPDDVSAFLLSNGIETRRVFYPLHEQPAFSDFAIHGVSYGASKAIAARGLSLPTWPGLTKSDLSHVAHTLTLALRQST